MDFVKLTFDKLSVEEIADLAGDPTCGAISLFVGTTRDNFDGKRVIRLEYEAYNDMAKKEIGKLCAATRLKFNVKNIAVYHRLGVVPVKEASIVIAVSAEHRRESLDAVSTLIDDLKALVPIWKKEIYDTGNGEWKQNKECKWIPDNKEGCDDEVYAALDVDVSSEVRIKEEPLSDKEEAPQSTFDISPEEEQKDIINSSLIQIVASKKEIERRIEAFQKRKREELDVLNVQEFCFQKGLDRDTDSCARTTSVVLRSLGSNSHLKLTKVVNPWGPQTLEYPGTLSLKGNDALEAPKNLCDSETARHPTRSKVKLENESGIKALPSLPIGIEERLNNIEDHLDLSCKTSVPIDLYSRIKAIEEKILYLESISPEYFTKGVNLQDKKIKMEETKATDDDISLLEVDHRMFELKNFLKRKQMGQCF